MWAIIDPASDAMIGRVGFFAFGEGARPEIAFLLSHAFWWRGLATEAAAACLWYGFDTHGWTEVVGLVRPANTPAVRVLAKLGMRREHEIVLGADTAVVYRVGSEELRAHDRSCSTARFITTRSETSLPRSSKR